MYGQIIVLILVWAHFDTDPFKETTRKINVTIPEAVEEIDIGGSMPELKTSTCVCLTSPCQVSLYSEQPPKIMRESQSCQIQKTTQNFYKSWVKVRSQEGAGNSML